MRFKLRLLFIAVALIAILIVSVDAWSGKVVTIEFDFAWKATVGTQKFHGVPTDYAASFTVDEGGVSPLEGIVLGCFGYNALLKKDVQKQNLSGFEDCKANLYLRRRPFPWSPPSSISDALMRYFVSVQGRPSPDGRSIFGDIENE